MKKAIPIFLLVVIFGVAIFLWKKDGLIAPPRSLATLVAPDAIAFLQIGNLPRTAERWQGTELAQIAEEPTVKAFLQKPLSKLPRDEAAWKTWGKLSPRGGFIALARMEGNLPVATLGVEYKGERKEAERALADWQAQLKTARPEGTADVVQHGEVTIETYAAKEGTVATALVKDWFFAGTNVAELEATVDRLIAKTGQPTLAQGELFKKTMTHLPTESDVVFYLNPKELFTRLSGILAATGKPMDPEATAKLQKIRAVSAAMKIDGPIIRDVWFSYQPGLELPPDLQQHALALTSPATLLFLNAALQLPEKIQLGDPTLDLTGLTGMLGDWQALLASQGLKFEDVIKAVGPEAALGVDWVEGVSWPTAVASLDVKDRATVQKTLDLVTNRPGSPPWAKQTVKGTAFYGMPASGLAAVQPTLAVTDRFLLAGLNYEAVKKAADEATKPGDKLDTVPAFKTALKQVPAPGAALFYVDSASLFQKLYSQARPMVMLYAAFSKGLSDYADMSKLPEPGVIAKHLTPIIYTTGKTSDGGYLGESSGPITATQALLGVSITAGVAAVPLLKNYLPDLNIGSLPGVLSPTPPASAPPSAAPTAPAAPANTPASAPLATPEPTDAQ